MSLRADGFGPHYRPRDRLLPDKKVRTRTLGSRRYSVHRHGYGMYRLLKPLLLDKEIVNMMRKEIGYSKRVYWSGGYIDVRVMRMEYRLVGRYTKKSQNGS